MLCYVLLCIFWFCFFIFLSRNVQNKCNLGHDLHPIVLSSIICFQTIKQKKALLHILTFSRRLLLFKIHNPHVFKGPLPGEGPCKVILKDKRSQKKQISNNFQHLLFIIFFITINQNRLKEWCMFHKNLHPLGAGTKFTKASR